MLPFNQYTNAEAAVIKLLRYFNNPVDPEIITGELGKHPDYPSLLAVSDVLTTFHVENVAFRVEFDEIGAVPIPFLAHRRTSGGDIVLVKKIKNGRYYLASDKWDNHQVNADEFRDMYNGVVLTARPSTHATGPSSFSTVLTPLKIPALFIGGLLLLAAALIFHTSYLSGFGWQLALLSLFKTAGLITTILLLIQSIDSNNPLVQVLCQTLGKTDCTAILSSNAAKVFDGLSWSEVGFFYFTGTWLLLLFGGNSPVVWQTTAVLNVISLPYTFYSIYYQWRIAKQWCVLCCTVQAILWLEFITIASGGYHAFGGGWNDIDALSTIFICLLTPVILWLTLKPMLLRLQTLRPLKQQLHGFKYNAEVFNKMLTDQPKYALPDESWSIVLGDIRAENIITMVSNPYCSPCAKTHALLDGLLNERTDLQARIVFTASNDHGDPKTPISRHLVELNDCADEATVRRALHDWYNQKQKNYQAWAGAYPIELKRNSFYKIDKQHQWCLMAEVRATPTLLLNGYRLPDLYQLTDLRYMLD